jgi:hypothetical protein
MLQYSASLVQWYSHTGASIASPLVDRMVVEYVALRRRRPAAYSGAGHVSHPIRRAADWDGVWSVERKENDALMLGWAVLPAHPILHDRADRFDVAQGVFVWVN